VFFVCLGIVVALGKFAAFMLWEVIEDNKVGKAFTCYFIHFLKSQSAILFFKGSL